MSHLLGPKDGSHTPFSHIVRHKQWFTEGQIPNPFNSLQEVMHIASAVVESSTAMPKITWKDDNKTCVFNGHRFTVSDMQRLVEAELSSVEQVFRDEVLLGFPLDQLMPECEHIVDNLQMGAEGYSFLNDEANPFHGAKDNLAKAILNHPTLSAEFAHEGPDGQLVWHEDKVAHWRLAVHRVKVGLFLVLHITDGAPARGTEIVDTLHTNTWTRLRNLFAMFDRVCVVGQYNKTTHNSGDKIIPRAVHHRPLHVLLPLLVFVNPLEQTMVAAIEGEEAASLYKYYVFVSCKGKWSSPMVSDYLRTSTSRIFDVGIGLAEWRHVAISTMRHHLHEGMKLNPTTRALVMRSIFDLQTGHTPDTASRVYALEFEGMREMDPQVLKQYIAVSGPSHFPFALLIPAQISLLWHIIMGLDPEPDSEVTHHDALEHAPPNQPALPFTLSQVVDAAQGKARGFADGLLINIQSLLDKAFDRMALNHTSRPLRPVEPPTTFDISYTLLHHLREYLQEPAAQFTSPHQARAIAAILNNRTSTLIVLPTGGGKSLVFLLPVWIEGPSRTTIVVLPQKPLVADIQTRVRPDQQFAVWSRQQRVPNVGLVFVSPEDISDDSFIQYVEGLGQFLQRFVFDEGHQPAITSNFRYRMQLLQVLGQFKVPTFVLSATVPLASEHLICQTLGVSVYETIRTSTLRPTLAYHVSHSQPEHMGTNLEHLIAQHNTTTNGSLGIIFTRSKYVCEQLAEKHHFLHFHADLPPEVSESNLRQWLAGESRTFIVATTYLGLGIDTRNVSTIIHYEAPWSLVGYSQETGRAGREGQLAECHILYSKFPKPKDNQESRTSLAPEVEGYLDTKGCRRFFLSSLMDEQGFSCSAIKGSNPCDNCFTVAGKVPVIGQPLPTRGAPPLRLLPPLATPPPRPPPPAVRRDVDRNVQLQQDIASLFTTTVRDLISLGQEVVEGGLCTFHVAVGDQSGNHSHSQTKCPIVAQRIPGGIKTFWTYKKTITFENGPVCWLCWMPQETRTPSVAHNMAKGEKCPYEPMKDGIGAILYSIDHFPEAKQRFMTIIKKVPGIPQPTEGSIKPWFEAKHGKICLGHVAVVELFRAWKANASH